MARAFLFCAPLLLALCVGCPGSLEDPARFTTTSGVGASPSGASGIVGDAATCDDVPKSIFLRSCVNAGCHNAQDKVQGLDLQSSNVEARLIGMRASEGAGLLIDPAAPEASVIYTKLSQKPPFGARMPLSGALDDGQIACVLIWITQQSVEATDSGMADDAAALDANPSDIGAE